MTMARRRPMRSDSEPKVRLPRIAPMIVDHRDGADERGARNPADCKNVG